MTGFRLSLIFISALCILLVNCSMFGDGTMSNILPGRESGYKKLLKALPTVNTKTLKSNMHLPPKLIGHKSFYRRIQDKFTHLKGYLLKKSYDISNYFYHLYFRGVGRVEDFVVGRMCHPLTKNKYPLATKFLCKVEHLLRENATRNNEYLVISAAKNILKDIRKPTSGIFSGSTSLLNTKQNAISPSLSSLSNQVSITNTDTFKSYITNSAKDLVPDLVKPTSYYNRVQKTLKDSSRNPINKLYPSWLSKKKNLVSSALTSLPNQIPIPGKDTIKYYITNPAKELVPDLVKPNTYYNSVKTTLKKYSWNTINKLYPSWLRNKKNQVSSALTSLPNQIPIQGKDTVKSYITDPVKHLTPDLVKSTTYYNSVEKTLKDSSWNPINKLYPSWLSKKKNQVSSALTSLPNQIPFPNKDTLKSYITNPVKHLVPDLMKPSSYFNSVKKTLKDSSWNPINKLYPSWLSKKKNLVSSALTSLPNQIPIPDKDTIQCYITNPAKEHVPDLVKPTTYYNSIKTTLKKISWNPINKLYPSWLSKKKNLVSSTLTFLPNQIPVPNKETLKSYITDPVKHLVPDLVKPTTYYNSVKKTLKDSSWNPINKLYPSWLSKKKNLVSSALTSLPNQIPIPDKDTIQYYITNPAKELVPDLVKPTTYYNSIKTTLKKISWNPVNKLYPSWLSKKKDQVSSALTSLPNHIPVPNKDTLKSYITDPVKHLVPDLVKPTTYYNSVKKTLKVSSWNPINKVYPSWLSKKKNLVSSALTSLPNQIPVPNKDTLKSYITVPVKHLVPDLVKPSSYYNIAKNALKSSSWNPINKLYPSWFSKKKDQMSSALTSLPNHITVPYKDTLKSYIINPAKHLVPDLVKPSYFTGSFKNILNRFAWNPFGNWVTPSFSKIAGFCLSSFFGTWATISVQVCIKFRIVGLGIVAVTLAVLLYRSRKRHQQWHL